jgi:hypothetical protein
MNKTLIITLSSVLVASYVGFIIYQKVQKKKSEKALNAANEDLEKLKEAQKPVFDEYEYQMDLSTLTDSKGQPKIFTF